MKIFQSIFIYPISKIVLTGEHLMAELVLAGWTCVLYHNFISAQSLVPLNGDRRLRFLFGLFLTIPVETQVKEY